MSARRSTCAGVCAPTSPSGAWRAIKPGCRACRRRVARGRLGARGTVTRSRVDSRAAADRQRRSRRPISPRAKSRARSAAMSSSSCRRSRRIRWSWLARVDGEWMMQRTRRGSDDLAVHAQRVMRFFRSRLRREVVRRSRRSCFRGWPAAASAPRASIRTTSVTRELRARLAALFRDDRLFRDASNNARIPGSDLPRGQAQLDRASGYERGGRRFESAGPANFLRKIGNFEFLDPRSSSID